MTTERLRRRLDALQSAATGMPTKWHRLITPKDDMEDEEYEAWVREATAQIPPDEGVIVRRIVTPEGVRRRNGTGAEEA